MKVGTVEGGYRAWRSTTVFSSCQQDSVQWEGSSEHMIEEESTAEVYMSLLNIDTRPRQKKTR